MKASQKILNKIQTLTSTTKSELMLISLVLIGTIFGALYKNYYFDAEKSNLKEAYLKADSLSTVKIDTNNLVLTSTDTLLIAKNERNQKVLKLNKDLPFEKININKAVKHELMKIPGIGEKSAESIIAIRKTKAFESIENIKQIKGIGEKKFEKLKDFIKVK